MHYPVGGKELSDILHGLLGKYRSMLMQMQDELQMKQVANKSITDSELGMQRNIVELQKEIADGIKERNMVIEDREKIYEMAELLKAKYATLLSDRVKLSEDLAVSKENNLELATQLLDKNLELTSLREEKEKEIYELNTQLVAATTHIQDLDIMVSEQNFKMEELLNEIADNEKAKGVLREEMQSLHEEIGRLNELVERERDKTIELGSELLTLVNKNELLSKDLDEANERYSQYGAELKSRDVVEEQLRSDLRDALKDVKSRDAELEELNRRLVTVELDAKQSKLTSDQLTLELREKIFNAAAAGKPLKETSVSILKYEELQGSMKKTVKMNKGLERTLNRTLADLDETRKEKAILEGRIADVTEKYRNKLSGLLIVGDVDTRHQSLTKLQHRRQSRKESIAGKMMMGFDVKDGMVVDSMMSGRSNSLSSRTSSRSPRATLIDGSSSGGLDSPSRSITPTSSAAAADGAIANHQPQSAAAQLQQQLIDSYAERELQQALELTKSLEQRLAIKTAYRELYDKYRATLDILEDHLTKGPKVEPLEEHLKFSEVEVREGDHMLCCGVLAIHGWM